MHRGRARHRTVWPRDDGGRLMFDLLRQDFVPYRHKWRALGPRMSTLRAWFTYGWIAVCVYRYGRWTRRMRWRVVRVPCTALYVLMKIPVELLLGIDISVNSLIGPGLCINHFGGIFLHCNAGRNLTLGQGVTVGYRGAGRSDFWPELGNDIYIGAGAKVIGAIKVGDGVVIGANTVVTRHVPAHTRVVGAAVRMDPLPRDGAEVAGVAPRHQDRRA